ncbi:type II secretion system F family protein [Candidatus Kaiserbacteria bacterium]|nr:type II secretion system F family protein [Candidatus Kaiserbacteria bacterium]
MNKPDWQKLRAEVGKHAKRALKEARRWKKHAHTLSGHLKQLSSRRLSIKDQAFFAKRLAFLITAGVPIMESLIMIHEQARSRAFSRVIDVVIDDVANGQYLSKSLERFPEMFGQFAVNLIKVGETSGTLSQNLDYLADELKKKQMLRRKIIGALIYPAVITFATLGITAFLMVYLFPKIIPVFLSLRTKLPLSTRIVIAISSFLRHWGLLLIFLIVAGVAAFMVARKRSGRLRTLVDRFILKVPVLGTMTRYYNLANITRTLGLLLKTGTTLSAALAITADTSMNIIYQQHLAALGQSVIRGKTLSVYLDQQREIFGDILCQMVAVGERSGTLSSTLIYLSEFYEHELDDYARGLSSLIEPALMICMGLLIGFVAISIITPIYAITQNLHP